MKIKSTRAQHMFNSEKKDNGPLLIIDVATRFKGKVILEKLITHQWVGSGTASIYELEKLCRHYKKDPELFELSEYIKSTVVSAMYPEE